MQHKIILQANQFASMLLLPTKSFTIYMENIFKEERIRRQTLYLDNQIINRQLVSTILSKISNDYAVSMGVARMRLIRMGFLEDKTDSSIKAIISKIDFSNLFEAD